MKESLLQIASDIEERRNIIENEINKLGSKWISPNSTLIIKYWNENKAGREAVCREFLSDIREAAEHTDEKKNTGQTPDAEGSLPSAIIE